MEDSLIVMAHLENKMSQIVRENARATAEHEDRLREHARFIAEHERANKKHDEKMAELDVRIEKIVSAIGTLISHIPPGTLQ